MPQVTTDFSQAGSFEIIPVGDHKVRVLNSELKTSKTSGNQYINWTLEVFGSDNLKLNKRRLWVNTTFFGKGSGVLRSLIEAATGDESVGGNFVTESLHGAEVVAVVKHQLNPQTKEPRESVQSFKKLEGGPSGVSIRPEAGFDGYDQRDELPF